MSSSRLSIFVGPQRTFLMRPFFGKTAMCFSTSNARRNALKNPIFDGLMNSTKSVFKSDSEWTAAVKQAEKVVNVKSGSMLDIKKLVGKEIGGLTNNIKTLIQSNHPLLDTVSRYYFEQEGKHFRPLIVLLMSKATHQNGEILASQSRLAEITEMIHTASLLHDDVIDKADTRRNLPSANIEFGNKMAVLAGDYLLAKASIELAHLKNLTVVELLATVIANLVEGEFMQMKSDTKTVLDYNQYIRKTYLKTATLIAKSCKASTLLSGQPEHISEIAYEYGKNLGLAFQLVDDMLDFTSTDEKLGKPSSADLKLGLVTAPVLFALQEQPDLLPLIERQFSHEGDPVLARELVLKTKGIEMTRKTAEKHCQLAIEAVSRLHESDSRTALINLTNKVLTRDR